MRHVLPGCDGPMRHRWAPLMTLAFLIAGCGSRPVLPTSQPSDASPSPVALASVLTASKPPVSTAPCALTAFETIPANDVVGWDQRTWQRAAAGVWGHPYLADYTTQSGFSGTEPDVKILWWVLEGGSEAVVLDVMSVPAGAYAASYSYDAPGQDRRDRPTGFPTPPPGCYEIRITIGARNGAIVDRVLP